MSFTARVQGTGPFNQAVTWSVDGINGGDTAHGTISGGFYTAPSTPPNPSTVTIAATSVQDSTKSDSSSATVYSLVISPANPTVPYGHTQQFTAQVTGLSNPTVQFLLVQGYGTTTSGGLYTATTEIRSQVEQDTISATVLGGGSSVTTQITVTIPPPILNSITPNGASAWESVTISGQDLFGPTQLLFPGPNGTILPATFQQVSLSELTATVPSGAASGPVYVTCTPIQGVNDTSNSVQFIRLPNLLVHAPSKDLSSGETMQFEWALLGANSPAQMNWTTDSGTINAGGLFQAPIISAESYSHVTGCLQDTRSCNSVLLRILPFRITPPAPIIDLGKTIQLDALQGASLLTPQWSVLAGGGNITVGGLFTAPIAASQAGPVPIAATVGATTQQTSVAVTGAFPGLVNRVYDYINFNDVQSPVPEGAFVESVAVNGNRAYSLSVGAPFEQSPAYAAIDVYDISNPDQPVWIDAVESASDQPGNLFIYGNNLFDLGINQIVVYSLQGTVPTLTGIFPFATLYPNPFEKTVNSGIVYVLPTFTGMTSFPVDLYDVRSGTVVHSHYDLPTPPDDQPGMLGNVTGVGNIVYVSWVNNIGINPRLTIATYDISISPPKLVATVLSDNGFELQVANQLLFADTEIYDISNIAPQWVASLPVLRVWGVQGNQVLARGTVANNVSAANYVVVDISNPMNPVINANVADLLSWDVFINSTATWANGGRFYSTDGLGGLAVYNVATPGGASTTTKSGFWQFTYDQALQQQTLYSVGVGPNGSGGLAMFDLSSSTPSVVGSLLYPSDPGFAVQVSGTNVFLGLADSLKTVDVSNPSNPIETASVPIPINALTLSGMTLFAGTGDGRLVVLDVSNPTAPKTIATVAMSPPVTMRLLGTLLYVAEGPAGMGIFDVSNPAAPALVSRFSMGIGAPVWDVSPQGSYVVLAAGNAGLVTVDVSTPAHPRQLAQQALPLLNAFPAPNTVAGIVPASSLAFQSGITYLGTTAGLEFAFDATAPANPRLVAFNAVGPDDISVISVITPGANSLYLAVDSSLAQLENSSPRNSIELYYPPRALSDPMPIGEEQQVERSARNPRIDGIRRASRTASDRPDRFGFSRTGRGRCPLDSEQFSAESAIRTAIH